MSAEAQPAGAGATPLPARWPRRRFALLHLSLQAVVVGLCLLVISIPLPAPGSRYAVREATVAGPDGPTPALLPATFPGSTPRRINLALSFTAPDRLTEEWSVLTPRFTNAAQILVNGVVVLDTRRNASNNRPDRNAADMAVIPAQLLRPGVNELSVRLYVWGPLSGFLDTLYVGPDSILRDAWGWRVLLFDALPVVLSSWQVILALVLGIMWFKRRQETAYGVLAAAMALGALRTFLIPPEQVSWLAGIRAAAIGSAPLESGLMLLFCMLFLGRRLTPLFTALALAPGVIIAVAGLAGGPDMARQAFIWPGLPAMALCLGGVAWLTHRAALARRDLVSVLLASAATVLATCLIRDVLTIAGALPHQRIFVTRMAYAAVMTVTGACLTWRFASALNEVDSFAGRLVSQVREAEDKLRASFAREEQRKHAAALASERARLTRDLHDGLGGQLVSIVALAERSGGAHGAQIGEAARSALRDLRLVIDAMDDIDGDLMLALGAWRERTAARLRPHDIRLDWQPLSPGGLPVHQELRPWHVIQLLRLLDEAVTNTVKHANAGCITVSFGSFSDGDGPARGRIIIADDGHGFSGQATPQGRGLDNMRRRAGRCGVSLSLDSGPDGVRVTLDLPARFPETEIPA